jgi:hypothetical protein
MTARTPLGGPAPLWGPPEPAALRRLCALIQDRLIDAVTFTSVPAVRGLLDSGGAAVLDRLRTTVVAACVGPEVAEPLVDHGVRSRTALRRVLPPGADGHTVDMAVARLRARLGPAFVEAVPRRGYRLAQDAVMEGRA